MGKFKTINGERFSLYAMTYTKSDAENIAKELRKKGYKARVFKSKGRETRNEYATQYKVYKRGGKTRMSYTVK